MKNKSTQPKLFDVNFATLDGKDLTHAFVKCHYLDQIDHAVVLADGVEIRFEGYINYITEFATEDAHRKSCPCLYDPPVKNGKLIDVDYNTGEYIGNKDDYPKRLIEHQEKIGTLYNADPNCWHIIKDQNRGGIKCTKCKGWFCF